MDYLSLGTLYLSTSIVFFYVYPGSLTEVLTKATTSTVVFLTALWSFCILVVVLIIVNKRPDIARSVLIAIALFFTSASISIFLSSRDIELLLGYAAEPGSLTALLTFFIVLGYSAFTTNNHSNLRPLFISLFIIFGLFISVVLLLTITAFFEPVYADSTLYIATIFLPTLSLYIIEKPHTAPVLLFFAYTFLSLALLILGLMPLSYILISGLSIYSFCYFKIIHPSPYLVQKKLPFISIITLLIVILLSIFSLNNFNLLSKYTLVTPVPSFKDSVTVAANISRESKLETFFGTGPNTFNYSWIQHRPIETNKTLYWNNEFTTAKSYILNFLVELGLLGTASFAIVILTVLVSYFKLQSQNHTLNQAHEEHLLMSLLIISLALLLIAEPTLQLLYLVALSLGILAGYSGIISTTPVKWRVETKVLQILLLILVTSLISYIVYTDFNSVVNYEKSSIAHQKQDFEKAKSYLESAIKNKPKSLYYRTLAEIYHEQIIVLINKDSDVSQEDRDALKILTTLALRNIETAKILDETHYLNWLVEAKLLTTLALLGAPEARVNGAAAYRRANSLAPNSALVLYSMSEHEYVSGNSDAAKFYLHKSIYAKPDYREAQELLEYIWQNEN